MKNILFVACLIISGSAFAQNTFRGSVFLDLNQNMIKDAGEEGLKGVLICNGRAIVETDRMGKWKISAEDASSIFLIKPAAYNIPVNGSMVPQHYINSSSYDFPLWKGEKVETFEAIFYGDTQTRGMMEVNYLSHDVVEECIGKDAAFGIVLGDIVADEPWLFDEVAASLGQTGFPWYYVFGNHDHDRDAKGNQGADHTFSKNFGPSSYAYEVGDVAFISLNNIDYKEAGGYRGYFSEDQLSFVSNYLSRIPDEKLVVLMMHIPIVACENREAMYRLIEQRSNSLSISGHTHRLAHVFVDESQGWKGAEPHHHFINGTACGSWWCGIKDELGIPHATMNDGAPNGYAIISFSGSDYDIQYKAARRPEDYQMNIYLPEEISINALDSTKVLVNVFNGSAKSEVVMKMGQSDEWLPMSQIVARDPANLQLYERGKYLDHKIDGMPLDEVMGWKMDFPSESDHFWSAQLPEYLSPGTHLVTVRTIDMFGHLYQAHRIFRVIP